MEKLHILLEVLIFLSKSLQNFNFVHKIDFLESFIIKLPSDFVVMSGEEIKVDTSDIRCKKYNLF